VTSHDRWQRIEDVFHRAADLPLADRRNFLASTCAGDPDLHREVESLLAADEDAGAVIGQAVAGAATSLREDSGLSLPPGSRIGPYAVIALVGRGGMGAVYRAARDGDFRMEVALKLIKRGADTDAALSRFRKERQILAGLQHPNIARLLDGGATGDGLPYFAMEYVEGKPLLEYAAPLPIGQRLELFRSICAAVQYAHQNLIVHRDLKPANILVAADGTPKLLDFGIAKLLDPAADGSGPTRTIAGAAAMTPDYASPEQVRGGPVTTATDVYSLGAILFELLTGERPHRLDTYSRETIEKAICHDEPRRPSAINRALDSDLDNIVLTALRKEPQRRYASVEQLSEDVRRHLEGRPVRARKDTFAYRARKFIRRNRIGVAAAAIAAAAVAAGIVAVNRQARRAEYRFQQVRKLAHSVLFDLNPEIENLAGSTKARELLVKTSLSYLDSLAAEESNDAALQLELAEAYEQIGDVQGNPKGRNLGQEEAALASYAKAIGIARRLDSRTALELVARDLSKVGLVQGFTLYRRDEGRATLTRAVEAAESIPERTGAPDYRARAEAYGNLGDVDEEWHPELARGPYERSLGIARQWAAAEPTRDSRDFLGRAIARHALSLASVGDPAGSRDSFMEALRVIEDLRKEQPAEILWRMRHVHLVWQLGLITGYPRKFNLGDLRGAAGWLEQAVQESAALAEDRYDEWARYTQFQATGALAAVLGEAGSDRSDPLFHRALALGDSLLQLSPDDMDILTSRMETRLDHASLLRKLGRSSEALEEAERATAAFDRLYREQPTDLWRADSMAVALLARAACRLDLGRKEESASDLSRALGILEPLHATNPRSLKVLRDLADCRQGFGDLAASHGDWSDARVEYARSVELWDSWKTVGVTSVYDATHRNEAAVLLARAEKNFRKKPAGR
jgi:tetratricopeptide (TPR) repeat protein